jgi:hypothetical protein
MAELLFHLLLIWSGGDGFLQTKERLKSIGAELPQTVMMGLVRDTANMLCFNLILSMKIPALSPLFNRHHILNSL